VCVYQCHAIREEEVLAQHVPFLYITAIIMVQVGKPQCQVTLKAAVILTVVDHVMCNPNPCLSGQLVRLTLKVMIQSNRYFMEVMYL
jgi:hypothetical protein